MNKSQRKRIPLSGQEKDDDDGSEPLLHSYTIEPDRLVVQMQKFRLEAVLLEREGRDGTRSSRIMELVTGKGVRDTSRPRER
jgi:hypothetical protein